MSRDDTAEIAKNMFGDSLYQQRAQLALPILVRQATAQKKITYSDLAQELGLPNPRNLNFVLGSVGTTLIELGRKWKEDVPPIQCLVINKATGLPGEGVDEFLAEQRLDHKLNRKQKEALVNAALGRVFAYPKWHKVLHALKLKEVPQRARSLIDRARRLGGGGESEDHRRLKHFVAEHPASVGLSPDLAQGETEFPLPSGDLVDVLFRQESIWIAIEVKSGRSSEDDLVRGLFQCVKYRAVIDAWLSSEGNSADVLAILALEGQLPSGLVALRNALGVRVVDGIKVKRKVPRTISADA